MIPLILNFKDFKTIKKIMTEFFKISAKFINFLIIFATFFLHFLVKWLKRNFKDIPFNDILFNIFMPIKGTEQNFVNQFFLKCLLPSICCSIPIFIIISKILNKIQKNKNIILNYKIFKKTSWFNITVTRSAFIFNLKMFNKKLNLKMKKFFVFIILIFMEMFCVCFSLFDGFKTLKIDTFLKENKQNSNFIKENYVDPKKVKLTFPEKKRNLIYIFAESMESSYFSKNLGGNEEFNLLQPLTKLTDENLNFSNSDKFGGACSTFGSKFTTAGLVSQTLGIPLKISPKIINLIQNHAYFFNNAYGLGNILKKAGYNQMFMVGSDKKFGNRDVLMENHGNYKIYDYYSAIDEGKIEPSYKVWWGIEDSKLFKIAKEKIKKLSKQKKPFNFTILTTNTHCPEGFLEPDCPPKFNDNYSNAIYYSAKQINDFVKWIKKQPFYENTTIIITGDHLSMAGKHFVNYSNNFNRTIFNLFVNCKTKPKKIKNRIFNSLDFFPTTLASLGVKIKGNKLGLGTNLFSKLKTLSEIYGIDYINKEFTKHSNFYDFNFIYKH